MEHEQDARPYIMGEDKPPTEIELFMEEYFKNHPSIPSKREFDKAKQEFKNQQLKKVSIMSEIKSSKIIKVHAISPPFGQWNTLYHKLELENGDKIDIGKNAEQKEGWSVDYRLTGDAGQYEFTKAKSVTKAEMEQAGVSTNTQSSSAPEPKKELYAKGEMGVDDRILMCTCLNTSGEILSRLSVACPEPEQVAQYAFKMLQEVKKQTPQLKN